MSNIADDLEAVLYEKFWRRHKVKITGDRGVLTATDSNFFVGLQLLFYSLTLSHEVKFAVVDLGMTERQVLWCLGNGLTVLPFPTDPVMPDRTVNYWQTWNKPNYIEDSPFDETLWLDADILVRGSLSHPFEVTSKDFFVLGSDDCPLLNVNHDTLYQTLRMFVRDRCHVMPNAGVLGFKKGRDKGILEAWKFAVRTAYENPGLKDSFAWYDQGALVWALEKTENTHLVRTGEQTYNYPSRHITQHKLTSTPLEFLRSVPKFDSAAVRHFSTPWKPWTHWDKREIPLDLSDSVSKSLKILVLSHSRVNLEKGDMRSYLELVDLNALEIGEHQRNELAESRIYLEGNLMSRFDGKEYVGLGSARWNEKYSSCVPRLEELHHYRDWLSPNRVLVPSMPEGVPWVETQCRYNPGIGVILEELSEFTGMHLDVGPTFWSNNFICHRLVFSDYLSHFLRVYDHFWSKYRNRFPFVGMDPKRTPAYFYEAVTLQYFSNRTDLEIVRLHKG